MKYISLLVCLCLLLVACKNKKISLKDDDTVGAAEFVEFFPEISLPFEVADTLLTRRETDSFLIGNKIFSQFVPDSILSKEFGKTLPKIYPLGRTQEKDKEFYLFVKAVQGSKRAGYVMTFSKDYKFLKSLLLVNSGFTKYSNSYGMLDKKFQITTFRERRLNNETSYKKNVYIYNAAAEEFSLILTEPNQDIIEEVINPIDTLAQKAPHAGDYITDKRNFVTFRDGKNASELLFFVHFEKDKGDCIGELKGTVRLVAENVAQYKEAGNPCTLEFTFDKNKVMMKEIEGCGSYRDIKCFFDGTYTKKTAEKSKQPKQKK